MEAVKNGRAYQYCQWCLKTKNRKVGKYVKLQAKAWKKIADGKEKGIFIDEEAYQKVCRLLEIIVHPDLRCNMHDGLEDYAMLMVTAVLCTKCKNEDGQAVRYYKTALLEIARKNFKTFTSAVIFIILMLTEPEFSRFFSVAPDLLLSKELQLAIRKIIKSSPELYDDDYKAFKLKMKQIDCLETDSEYTPLAYSQDRMDGKLANAFLADEAGAMDSYPIEAMRSSQITLDNALGIIISTQYPNDNNGFIDELDISKKVLDGVLANNGRFALIYEPDEEYTNGDAWMHEDNAIYQANPAAVSNKKMFERIVEKRTYAILYENKRENFLCKHLNIKYKGLGTEGYIDIAKVKLCRRDKDDKFWRGKRVFVGFDLSLTNDNTSVAMVCEDNGKIYGRVWGFVPGDRVEIKSHKEGVDYKKLIKQGVCFECGDEVIDYSFVEKFIIGLNEKYGVEVVQIGYDRYNATSTVQKLEEKGNECVEIKQHSSILHAPTKYLKEEILKKNFIYDDNQMLEINFQNARCTEDTNLNKYVNKKKSEGKVDMVVSLINAVYLLQQELLYGATGFFVQG